MNQNFKGHMKSNEIVLLLSIITIYQCLDPNDYIWINFGTQTIVKPYNVQFYEIPLPCQTRVGSCKYDFTLLPPGWSSQNNKLLIPSSQAFKSGTYSVQLTVRDITGQSLDFSLILDLIAGKAVTSDRGQFFRLNDFSLSPIGTNSITLSPKLSTFPTFQKIQQTVNSGSIISISSLVTDIVQRDGSCPQKLNYLLGARSLFQNKVAQVEGQIRVIATEIDTRFKQIQVLQEQKQSIKKQTDSNIKIRELQDKIKELNSTRTVHYQNFNRYTIIANSFLQKIDEETKSGAKIATNDQMEIIQMEKEVLKIDNEIKQLISQKKQLEKDIALQNLLEVSSQSSMNSLLVKSLEEQYRQYSDLAIQQKIKYQNIDYEISALMTSLNTPNSSNEPSIDDQIAKIQAQINRLKESSDMAKVEEFVSVKNILQSNAKVIRDQQTSLKDSCSN